MIEAELLAQARGGDAEAWGQGRYDVGRYYKENDAEFTSATLQPASGAPVRLLNARWTAYLPRENRQESMNTLDSVPSQGTPRLLDSTLKDARLEVDLDDGSGAQLIAGLGQGQAISRTLPAFRYRVRFLPTPTWDAVDPDYRDNHPVLETPFFDDITFACQSMTGPRLLSWESP